MFKTTTILTNKDYFFNTIIIMFIVTVIIRILQIYRSQRKLYSIVANMNTIPSIPILGQVHNLFKTTEEMLKKMCPVANNFKSPIQLWLGPYLYVATLKPEHLEIILNHPKTLSKDKFYKLVKSRSTLLCAPVEIWRKERKMVAPSFNQKILNSFIEIFEKNAIVLNNSLEVRHSEGEFNVYPFIINSTLHSIIETVFGSFYDSQDDLSYYCKQYARYCELILNRVRNVFFYLDIVYKNTKLGKEHRNIAKYLKKFALQIIQNKLDEYETYNMNNNKNSEPINEFEDMNENITLRKNSKVLIDSLIEDTTEGKFIKQDLLSVCSELILAATDTTAISTGFVLMMLGMHPDVQEHVYSEINEIFGSSDRNITVDDLSQLQYTEQVIKETLRLFPAVPIVLRESTADVKLGEEYTIPCNTGILIPIFTIHRNPELWTNPLQFDPERFSPENNSKRHPYSYIPFSGGSRNCIGYRYAMMSLKTTIATIIRKNKVKCSYKSPSDIRLKFAITLKPVEGHLISVERRTVL